MEVDKCGSNVLTGVLAGALLVAIAVAGFFAWDNYKGHASGGTRPTATIILKKN